VSVGTLLITPDVSAKRKPIVNSGCKLEGITSLIAERLDLFPRYENAESRKL